MERKKINKYNKDLVNQLVELFKMEPKKYEQFNKMMERTELLTSECGFDIEKQEWKKYDKYGRFEAQYFIYELRGTRSSMRIVVDVNTGDDPWKIIRKPRGIVRNEYWSQHYNNALGYEIWELM